jgi:hypothetical protein
MNSNKMCHADQGVLQVRKATGDELEEEVARCTGIIRDPSIRELVERCLKVNIC